jgi:hypothetical protein
MSALRGRRNLFLQAGIKPTAGGQGLPVKPLPADPIPERNASLDNGNRHTGCFDHSIAIWLSPVVLW